MSWFSGTSPVLAPEVLHPTKPLSPGQIREAGHTAQQLTEVEHI